MRGFVKEIALLVGVGLAMGATDDDVDSEDKAMASTVILILEWKDELFLFHFHEL